LSKTRLLHREKHEGCSHSKAVVHIVRATSREVALLMSGDPPPGFISSPPTDRSHPRSTMRQRQAHVHACRRIQTLPHRVHRTPQLRSARQESGCAPALAIQASDASLFIPLASRCNGTPIARPRVQGEHMEHASSCSIISLKWSLIEGCYAYLAWQGSDLPAITALRDAEGSS
jgi:hypothetical protein